MFLDTLIQKYSSNTKYSVLFMSKKKSYYTSIITIYQIFILLFIAIIYVSITDSFLFEYGNVNV